MLLSLLSEKPAFFSGIYFAAQLPEQWQNSDSRTDKECKEVMLSTFLLIFSTGAAMPLRMLSFFRKKSALFQFPNSTARVLCKNQKINHTNFQNFLTRKPNFKKSRSGAAALPAYEESDYFFDS